MKYLAWLIFLFPVMPWAQPSNAPTRVSLVDTGYDLCNIEGGSQCQLNKNLLFRGDQPLDDTNDYSYDPGQFKQLIFSYLQEFKNHYQTNAKLPTSIADLNNYRIVIINLLYDSDDHGSYSEFTELTKEFNVSGVSDNALVPEQHKIYGLKSNFEATTFAFQWWPITLLSQPYDINSLNWPNTNKIPVERTNQYFKPMNFPYLVTGKSWQQQVEKEGIDLVSLLKYQPQDHHPLLIFYHCVAGKDRTGAVTMSYFMVHGGYANIVKPNDLQSSRSSPMNYQQAFSATINKDYPQPKRESQLTAQAFCAYLNNGTCKL